MKLMCDTRIVMDNSFALKLPFWREKCVIANKQDEHNSNKCWRETQVAGDFSVYISLHSA